MHQGRGFRNIEAKAALREGRWQVKVQIGWDLGQANSQTIKGIRELITDVLEQWWAAEGRAERAKMFQINQEWLEDRIKTEARVLQQRKDSLKEMKKEIALVNELANQDGASALGDLLQDKSVSQL